MPGILKIEYPWGSRKPPYGTPLRDAPITKGLVSLWTFNESAGPQTFDPVGLNKGTLLSAVWSTGLYGPAAFFSGTGNGISTPNAAITLGPLTLFARINGASYAASSFNMILSGVRTNLYIAVNSKQFFGKIASVGWSAPGTLTPGAWYDVGMTYDTSQVTLYVNGQAVFSTAWSTNPPANEKFYIGTFGPSVGTLNFNGLIDTAGLYNRALSASEMEALSGTLLYDSLFEPDADWLAMPGAAASTIVQRRNMRFGNRVGSRSAA